jgi:hypothetical protein
MLGRKKKPPEPKAGIDWMAFAASLMSGNFPVEAKTSTDHVIKCLGGLVDIYLLDNGMMGKRLDGLVDSLLDSADPFVQQMDGMTRMAVFAGLNNLKKRKEQIKNEQAKAKAKSNQAIDSGNKGDTVVGNPG